MRRRVLSALALAAVALAAVGGVAAAAAKNPAASFVLTPHDVGSAYKENTLVSGPRTFADVSAGDSTSVQKQIRKDWIGGTEASFNGVKLPYGIVSLADVFRSASIGSIVTAWQNDYVTISKGKRVSLPGHWPGTHGVLIEGHIATAQLFIYLWQHGRTIASVDVTSTKGTIPLSFVLQLASAQDHKITAGP